MFTMGSDFQYEDAIEWYKNLDKLIHYVNKMVRYFCFSVSLSQDDPTLEGYNADERAEDFVIKIGRRTGFLLSIPACHDDNGGRF